MIASQTIPIKKQIMVTTETRDTHDKIQVAILLKVELLVYLVACKQELMRRRYLGDDTRLTSLMSLINRTFWTSISKIWRIVYNGKSDTASVKNGPFKTRRTVEL